MNRKFLFDTSVWIDFFSGTENEQSNLLTRFIEEDLPIYNCPTIIQEILQGIRNDKQFNLINESLLELSILNDDPIEAAVGAATIYRKLRKKGVTIRKSNDCLISWYALKNSVQIIHNDRDFDLILNNLSTITS
jgi:predicted nucleic acid-binding protein